MNLYEQRVIGIDRSVAITGQCSVNDFICSSVMAPAKINWMSQRSLPSAIAIVQALFIGLELCLLLTNIIYIIVLFLPHLFIANRTLSKH